MSRKGKVHGKTEAQVLISLDASDAANLTQRSLCCSLAYRTKLDLSVDNATNSLIHH